MAEPKKKQERLSGVKGMNDILPQDAALWHYVEATVRSLVSAYGYQNLRTPIVEHTALFTRGIGEVTDIVEKEMYSFVDALNGEHLSLRPENTAAVVRAAIEHNLLYDGPKRIWYSGPMFRHERPQRGRYRQFHQVGVEALGFAGPEADAEIILMCQRLWDDLGLSGIRLELNSLGQAEERARHREALVAYLQQHESSLDEDARRRLHSNPLRVLDTKNPAMQELANAAPRLIDFLGPHSLAHFEGVQNLLKANNIPFKINPRLVRGLDYYNLTVFEWVTDQLGAQGTVAGGGRYDPLIEQLGGKPTPACGWAMGMERILELVREADSAPAQNHCDVYVVHQGEGANVQAFIAGERLRDIGFDVVVHCNTQEGSASFKSQMKRADASGAAYAVIIGDAEVQAGSVSIKRLRAAPEGAGGEVDAAADGKQVMVPLEQLGEFLIDAMTAVGEDSN